MVALVAGGAISVDFISYIINVPKLIVFIEIAVSGVCVTIAVWCIACTSCSIVGVFIDYSIISAATSVVIGLTSFIFGILGPLTSITTWLGACINRGSLQLCFERYCFLAQAAVGLERAFFLLDFVELVHLLASVMSVAQ